MDSLKKNTAISIVKRLSDNGFQALFAGGYVRNMILGIESDEDIDIATNASPKTVSSLFRKVVGVGEHFGVMLVIENNIPFEVATFRADKDSLNGRHPVGISFTDAKLDSQRRDFTINGLFYDPLKKNIIDYVQGRKDIKKRIIRTIGDPERRFNEDYLRLLRAIRFAAKFSFDIEPVTWKAIQENAERITSISQERIFQELNKMFLGENADTALTLLDNANLLKVILPEVACLKGVEQPPEFHPEGDVFIHTVKTLSYLKNPTQIGVWSALLHDIGKPSTKKESDRIRFNNHHRVSARMARKILMRLKSPRALVNSVFDCVDNHMNFMNVTKMRLSTLKKFLSRSTFSDELELHRADCLASHGNINNYTFLLEKKNEMTKESLQPKPFLGGKDLIKLGFTPGPVFGVILNKVYDLQLDEQINSLEEALQWVKDNRNGLNANARTKKD